MSHKQVIVIRKDLNMRKGKCCSQAAHASMKAILDMGFYSELDDVKCLSIPLDIRIDSWLRDRFTKICVSVNSEAELLALYKKADDAGIICSLIQDAGLTEFGGVPTYTAVAIGPDKNEVVDTITGGLPLL